METVLYFGRQASDLGLTDRSGVRREEDGSYLWMAPGEQAQGDGLRLVVLTDPAAAERYLRSRPVDAVVLDARTEDATALGETAVGGLLERMFPESDPGGLIQRSRVVGIVGEGVSGAARAFHFGRYRVGELLHDPSLDDALGRVAKLLLHAPPGRVAICLAGGGIEGLLYELGVLRALDTFLVDRRVVDVDLFCGISAGAILGAFLANGIGPDELSRSVSGGSARVDILGRKDLFDLNFREVASRSAQLATDLARGGKGPRRALSSLVRAVPSAVFAGDRLRGWLERQLTKPGMTNSFPDLRRQLLVGATDQDTSEAVVFGEPGMDHVPIHKAVRASAALAPFYTPEEIDGRYYIDGSFSRTTNMRLATDHGSTLVILIDPLVPVFSPSPGYVRDRGAIFSTMQGLKALVNGRFDKAVRAIREMFPDVTFYLFRPEDEERRILSGSPMKYFFRREVEDIAFQATARKIRTWLPEMSRDFARHGITLRDPDGARRRSPTDRPLSPRSIGVGV